MIIKTNYRLLFVSCTTSTFSSSIGGYSGLSTACLFLAPFAIITINRQLFQFQNMDSQTASKNISQNSKSHKSLQAETNFMRYSQVNKQAKEHERQQVRRKEDRLKRQQSKKREAFLAAQIARKKEELSQLQEEGDVIEAVGMAKIKMEKDEIRRMETKMQKEMQQQADKNRSQQAKKWLKQTQDQINLKSSQAAFLRKTHCLSQKEQRKKANKTAQVSANRQLERSRAQQSQLKRKNQLYREGLKHHGLSKKPPRCHSHPHILISRQNEQQQLAVKKAEEILQKQAKKAKLQSEVSEQNRQKAEQRGQEAMARIKKEREFHDYCQEVSAQQKDYNLRRVAAGRQNQYTGLKPLTLSQIQQNKKIRDEAQFEQMFFGGKKIEKNQKIVSKYTIVENKMRANEPVIKKEPYKPKKHINYKDEESRINNVSEGRYSFEEERRWDEEPDKKAKEPYQKEQYIEEEHQEQARPILRNPQMAATKNELKETRAPGVHQHFQQSEDSAY